MASLHTGPVGPDTLITVKVIYNNENRKFKLAMRDLGANVFPQKLRLLLAIRPEAQVQFDRFSDSAGTYVTLDSSNPSVYKQLYRAAKAKLKLRLRATVVRPENSVNIMDEQPDSNSTLDRVAPMPPQLHSEPARQSYLETVLSQPPAQMLPQLQYMTTGSADRTMPGALYGPNGHLIFPPPPPTDRATTLSHATLPSLHDFSNEKFKFQVTIDCNNCDKKMIKEHYHCGTCEGGDFDLCTECFEHNIRCMNDEHWLIKRFVKDGVIIPSVTEKLRAKKHRELEIRPASNSMRPEVYTYSLPAPIPVEQIVRPEIEERTCNNCISQKPVGEFLNCKDCLDFDLCSTCFKADEHGHHPAHNFVPLSTDPVYGAQFASLCKPGRDLRHEAICDGCEAQIKGVRHKCLSCPDWDLCSTCVKTAGQTHPGHRFASLYEPLGYVHVRKEVHRGIYCDGPLCTSQAKKNYIRGDRFKCAICHDTDFCASCEALPMSIHDRTHPLIKFKTPINSVSITTLSQSNDGQRVATLGDRSAAKHASTETTPHAATNAATQVQTVAEVKPVACQQSSGQQTPVAEDNTVTSSKNLEAWFISDSTPDGTSFAQNRLVSQSWTLRNPGPQAWPAGCAVHFIGGDDMRNLETSTPSSVSAMTEANRSNVLEESLEPGKTAVFTVLLKSPKREGRAISYWRLKTPDGMPFGHKLWVDISVAASPALVAKEEIRDEPATEIKSESAQEIDELSAESSTMIFPKLEKESPVSSTHDVAQAPSVIVEPTTVTEDHELLEDVESLELEDSDEGFMTDEEYDILDASDEDFLVEAERAVNHK